METEESQNIIQKLNEINKSLTEDKIKNAKKEELIEYLKMIDEFKALLITAAKIDDIKYE